MKKLSVIVLGVEPSSLINLRVELLKVFVNLGLTTTTLSKKMSEEQKESLNKIGVNNKSICFSRNGFNPFADLTTLANLLLVFNRIKPAKVLAYTIKPVIWGGVAARCLKIDFYALITGLGFAFYGESFRRRFLTKLVVFLHRIALKDVKAVIFQNSDDRAMFIDKGIIPANKTHIVSGSGVDIEKFNLAGFPKGDIIFLCIARLLTEKGLREYAAAAKLVQQHYPNASFKLLGAMDSSPDALPRAEINKWHSEGVIDYLGTTHDVRPHIAASHVYVLPSYHEGIPRSSLEAMAMGRPIITTDAPGCRETVKESINGFKVPIRSIEPMVERMIWFIENPTRVKEMGEKSRDIVEQRFNVKNVNDTIVKIMNF